MSIKSDKWIRRMAEETGMIEPFEPGQVREVDGKKIISYGTSSYGYDIRCAPEFKVFTNIHSTVVDPKNFDEKSFVDFHGDSCIIPPNSFALARTMEYFRIPRNVLTICLGKSTYARCFRGDTRVALVDGTSPTLEDMARRAESGEMFWGYSMGENGRLMAAQLQAPRYIGRDNLVAVELDNGRVIHATPDHQFMLRDGRWMAAAELQPGVSLMPLYRNLTRGYETIYHPLSGHACPTHRLADEWNLRHGIYAETAGSHRHHVDHDRLNNNPWNIVRMPAGEHIAHHNLRNFGPEFDAQEHSTAIREGLQRRLQEPQWAERYSQLQSERANAFWQEDRYAQTRERLLAQRQQTSDSTRKAHRQVMLERYRSQAERDRQGERMRAAWAGAGSDARRLQQAQHAQTLRLREDVNAEAVVAALHQTGSIRAAARLLDCDRSTFRRFPQELAAFRGQSGKAVRNHKVTSVRSVGGEHDVYCLTVPEAGNFALEDGVFVHNCGIIVNVTPFEPEWEGYVTLEFSNTTPLPAKIYAGEGCAQVLFFESDKDDVCEVSYKDRGGKYQGQHGVTLPRA